MQTLRGLRILAAGGAHGRVVANGGIVGSSSSEIRPSAEPVIACAAI